jgi:hypothetical protein
LLSILLSLVYFYLKLLKISEIFQKKNMFRKLYQGVRSRKQVPRLAMRDADDEPPRNAPVRPCEWPSENFMD